MSGNNQIQLPPMIEEKIINGISIVLARRGIVKEIYLYKEDYLKLENVFKRIYDTCEEVDEFMGYPVRISAASMVVYEPDKSDTSDKLDYMLLTS